MVEDAENNRPVQSDKRARAACPTSEELVARLTGEPVSVVREHVAPDMVNHPPHYTAGAVECIDAIRAALGADGFQAYCKGQVFKYLWRAGLKGDALEDARKARWYLDRLIAAMDGADA